MSLLLWFGLVLAVVRVTRLLIKDTFPPIALPREWILSTFLRDEVTGRARMPGTSRWLRFWQWIGHSFAYVWTCMWCMSVWVGFGVWGITDWATRLSVPYPWLMVAVGSMLSGAWVLVENEHDQRWAMRQRDIDRPPR